MYKLSINNAIENHLHLISIQKTVQKAIKEKQKQIKNEFSTESKGINSSFAATLTKLNDQL